MTEFKITEEEILKQLQRSWNMVTYASEKHPDLVQHFVDRFMAHTELVEALTGIKYTATEDGVVKY